MATRTVLLLLVVGLLPAEMITSRILPSDEAPPQTTLTIADPMAIGLLLLVVAVSIVTVWLLSRSSPRRPPTRFRPRDPYQ